MLKNKKLVKTEAVEKQLIAQMTEALSSIYSNKSSDEYKSHGDIRKSSMYPQIEKMVADLKTLKKFPQTDASDIKTLFDTLHRPVFSKMVVEYMNEPNEKNTVFTTVYTVGYRVLISELARIFSSTVATEKGIEYKPTKESKNENMLPFIRSFNVSLEKRINEYIADINKKTITQQEGVMNVVTGIGNFVVSKGKKLIIDIMLPTIKAGIKCVNPITLINTILTSSYEKKVAKYNDVAALYEATKQAYDEYLRIPDNQRNKKVETKYVKNIEKYEIKMKNINAALQHYDSRANTDVEDNINNMPKNITSSTTSDDSDDTSTSDSGFDF